MDSGSKCDFCAQRNETLGELESRVYVTLYRVCDDEEMVVLCHGIVVACENAMVLLLGNGVGRK